MNTKNHSCTYQLPILCLVLAISACSSTAKPVSSEHAVSATPPDIGQASPTLYDQLGGQEGVSKLSEQFIAEIAGDERIRGRFAKTDIGRFYTKLQEHLCELTDGPCEYSGDNMKETHGGMNIRSSEFNAVVEALLRAMDSTQLPISTQNQLLERLAVFRPEIIGQ